MLNGQYGFMLKGQGFQSLDRFVERPNPNLGVDGGKMDSTPLKVNYGISHMQLQAVIPNVQTLDQAMVDGHAVKITQSAFPVGMNIFDSPFGGY